MPHPLFVLNGSNLNMLGVREPGLYGTTTLVEIERRTRDLAESLGWPASSGRPITKA